MKRSVITLSAIIMVYSGCSKFDFLDERPRKSLLIPNEIRHYQAILDNDLTMNGTLSQGVTPQLGESGADNFYLLDHDFNTFLRPQMQNYYIWASDPYDGVTTLDWEAPYTAILYANAVIDGLGSINQSMENQIIYNDVMGQALFHRAYMFQQLAQVFASVYDPQSNNDELGIILRLEADINENLRRATVQQTYDQIINDLSHAVKLLGVDPLHKCRPSRQAAYGLLARTYLSMGLYTKAGLYADSCLQIQDQLHDFNLVNAASQSPFQSNPFVHPINQEIIFFTSMLSDPGQVYPTMPIYARLDSNLFNSYDHNDLRKTIFFEPSNPSGYRFKGTYSFRNFSHHFSGLAVDEMLLIRAECYAREGKSTLALDDLNRLLFTRWRAGYYVPYEKLDYQQTLSLILNERRKELIFRGLRWSDLRRLNLEGYGIALERNLNGRRFTLPVEDPRWTWPIPPEVSAR